MKSKEKKMFPLFVDLTEKKILVVGAGKIASRRVKTLLPFAGEITVEAPEAAEELLDLAEKGNCVIVGRCADYILKDRGDCLHVFVHAPLKDRAERIVRLYGETSEKPEKRLMDKDKKRSVNYRYYTDREWGLSQNYHLCLDSSEFGIEGCVDIIVELSK